MTSSDFKVPSILWAICHTVGALFVTIFIPLWGAVWGAYAGYALARWAVGTGRVQLDARANDIVVGMRRLPGVLPAYGIAWVVAVLSLVWTPGILELLTLLAPVAIIGLPVAGGLKWERLMVRQERARERWIPALASVFGVAPSIVETAGLIERGDRVVINPVPPAMALRISPGHRAAVENAIAGALPHLMLDPASDEVQIDLVPVDAETADRRAALGASGGLLAGGPMSTPVESTPETPPTSLIFTEEDLR